MTIEELLSNFYNEHGLLLWILGIIIPFVISGIIPNIRKRIKKLIFQSLLRIQGNDVGISATYLRNYLEPPIGKLTDEIFQQIKLEISNDQIKKVSLHPRFLKIRSNKLGMNLVISIEQEHLDVEDEELQSTPYNVTIEMEADIKGTSNMHNLDEFVSISEKIQEIIRAKLFPEAENGQSYAVCTANNIQNDITNDSEKIFEFEDNKITLRKDSTTILSYSPRKMSKALKKYAYA